MQYKKRVLDVIKKSLNTIGYNDNKIIDEYPITNKDGNIIYFDFIAFGHDKIQDTSTSCISVKYCEDVSEENVIIEDAKCAAAPLLMLSKRNSVKLVKLNAEKKSEKIIEIKYDELYEYFSENRVKYDYNKIISSKHEKEQLSFFDTNNLFLFASKINCKLLGKEFKKALNSVEDIIDKNKTEQISDITSITMHIIAAKILNDKLLLDKKYSNIHDLLYTLELKYKDYFDLNEIYKYGKSVIDNISNSFSRSFSYRSIDNKLLGNFYESTLFESDESKNKKLKKDFGIYYTPSCLVNSILKSMPIELIDYRERYILDASCGSGSLLIGAYNRLKELLPANMDASIIHKYLTDMILGIDIDKFACEVAKLELLLNSIPYGNGWNIKNSDFLKINDMKFKPKIIIANPPYKEKRVGKIEQKAALFLDKYIDLLANGGLIGIVLPQTFLVNKSCIDIRKKLLENIKLYEIWILPKGVFDTNNCATTVIIGRKEKIKKDNTFKGKIVVQKSLVNFKNTGKFDLEFVCKSQNEFLESKDFKLNISPVSQIISKLENNKSIKDYTNDTQGIQIPYSFYPFISDTYKEGYEKYFRDARKGIERYNLDWSKQSKSKYIYYDPENLINKEFKGKKDKGLRLRESKRDIIEGKKVVMPINSTPGTFWRVKAAIDYQGIYVSHSLWCFNSKEDLIPLEVIVAVLNSKITNLYLENKNLEMSLNSENIRNIPFPSLNEEQKHKIVKYVKEIEKNIEVSKNQDRIDYILYKAFNLCEHEIYEIESYYKVFTKGSKYINKNESIDTVQVGGTIGKVDLDNNIVTAEFVESYEEKVIRINENIPGWLLSEKVPFTCRITEDNFYEDEVEVMDVSPIQYMNLSEIELQNLKHTNFNDYKVDDYKTNTDILEGGL
ncbi:HsdM family class I SAM-dependent methyltransferase [Paraclostridium bifermentans]|uniref:HsdM family class I SAM-dependent methyltransferase n=1 Tax=Paraclostridium bifermentans TaxID=1490 RepID=UPI000418F0AF|nr:SAM-dependent methyltransferase [Paraclostridium bifermentans]